MILGSLLFPLLGFFLNLFLWKGANKKLSGAIGTGAVGVAFLFVLGQILKGGFKSQSLSLGSWLKAGDLALSFSFIIDPLSLLMGLLITGVAFLIHVYSLGYMKKDPGFARYFAYLNLFVFFQLILVLAGNLPLLFVGWEGVGLCSYLLIGFWFKEKKKVHAGMLAFLVNRIADACFLLGIFCVFSQMGTVSFFELQRAVGGQGSPPLSALGPFLLFLGAIGKSAQIPFYFWLPKAMAGPTPVSALIHAATMVTAGVYLLVRMSNIYSFFPDLLQGIAWVGALTALGSAIIAGGKWDFKGILAYSTISQLAYLFMAIGVKAFSGSFFHLLTHGFFKALLFLCAGSVIHALKGEQDIRLMGGLRKSMPITFICYLMGALALMAMPPFSGFFSKDEILWSLFSSGNYGLFFMAFVTGLITVFYMTRLTVFVFFGESRSSGSPHESGGLMKFPMVALAILSMGGGVMGLPHLLTEVLPGHPPHILHELLKGFSPLDFTGSKITEALLMFFSTVAGLIVIAISAKYYLRKASGKLKPSPSFWGQLLEQGFFVDHGVQKYALPFFKQGAFQISERLEKGFFHQGIFFLTNQILNLRQVLSRLQSGNLQSYAFYFTMGLTVLMFLIFLR